MTDIENLGKESPSERSIAVVVATLHHKTGKEAFLLGYHQIEKIPQDHIYEVEGMPLGMFMPIKKIELFVDKKISLTDGYIELSRCERT
jgi:hypothetical protein